MCSDMADKYCEECKTRLGLRHMVPSEDYLRGAVDVVMGMHGDDCTYGELVGAVMRALKGRANAEQVAKLVAEALARTIEEAQAKD